MLKLLIISPLVKDLHEFYVKNYLTGRKGVNGCQLEILSNTKLS